MIKKKTPRDIIANYEVEAYSGDYYESDIMLLLDVKRADEIIMLLNEAGYKIVPK